jgi:hypothetical protein
MTDLLRVIVPLFGFMLIPLWIALTTIAIGAVENRVSPRAEHSVLAQHARRRADQTPAVGALVAQPAS